MSRRGAILGVAACAPLACQSRAEAEHVSGSGSNGAPNWGGLEVATVGSMKEDERGGVAVVLLHGWGARGDDLVGLARALVRPRTRFFVPAAPLPEGTGRAWWHLDPADRPSHAWDDQGDANYKPHRQVAAVRASVQTVLTTIRSRYAPDVLVLGGFSQGAMVSYDVALAADPPVDRVVAMSGVMLADSLPGLRAPHPSRPSIFVSHGRKDAMLPFEAALKAKEMLERHGYSVEWHPFDGVHEIPASVVQALGTFLFG
jgi:phospholipase/carboxylesterase